MDEAQLRRYLTLTDLPRQLQLRPDEAGLYLLYRHHVTRFPYQNVDLYRRHQAADLSVAGLLDYMSEHGGHCYQQSELLHAALVSLGFSVARVASWVLMGRQFCPEQPRNHNILLVTIGDSLYICDPGLASASPRWPLRFNMRTTEEIQPCQGDQYKLEVEADHYNLYWMMRGEYLLLYRFERDCDTKLPKTCEVTVTRRMCEEVYSAPVFIPIRDQYVKVSRQTADGVLSFLYVDGEYSFKTIKQGKPVEDRKVDCAEFFKLIKQHCGINFDATDLKK